MSVHHQISNYEQKMLGSKLLSLYPKAKCCNSASYQNLSSKTDWDGTFHVHASPTSGPRTRERLYHDWKWQRAVGHGAGDMGQGHQQTPARQRLQDLSAGDLTSRTCSVYDTMQIYLFTTQYVDFRAFRSIYGLWFLQQSSFVVVHRIMFCVTVQSGQNLHLYTCQENLSNRMVCIVTVVLSLLQGKAGNSMGINDNNDGAGYPLFTFVDENIFKKETFLGKCTTIEKRRISQTAQSWVSVAAALLLHNRDVPADVLFTHSTTGFVSLASV